MMIIAIALISGLTFAQNIQVFSSSAKETIVEPAVQKKNLSGLTFNPHTSSYYGIINRGDRLYEFDEKFNLKRAITISGFDDPEDIAFVRMTEEGPLLAISDETGTIHIGVLPASSNELSTASMRQITLVDQNGSRLEFWDNKGLEGITYLPEEDQYIIVREKPVTVWSFKINDQGHTAVVGKYLSSEMEKVVKKYATDLSAVSFNAKSNEVVLLSDESSCLIHVDHKTKQVTKVVRIEKKLQHEGLAFSRDFETAYVAAEPYYLLEVHSSNTRQVMK